MRLIIITLLLLLVSSIGFSQNNSNKTIEVDGVCKMCKKRIEKACLKTKGVKSAVWNVKTHELNLIYNKNKYSSGWARHKNIEGPRRSLCAIVRLLQVQRSQSC